MVSKVVVRTLEISLTIIQPHRVEADAFGQVNIPIGSYWGAQTQRALAAFGQGVEHLPPDFIHAFGLQKAAAARANCRLGVLDQTLADVICQAATELSSGKFDNDFPLSIWQTGSGTQTNMCANEVIANRVNEILGQPLGSKSPIHPNDHVNLSQSSNDTFPTVMHMASLLALRKHLLPALRRLAETFIDHAQKFSSIVKIGRTHLMDAVPMTLGQNFDAYAQQVLHGIYRIESSIPALQRVPQGGTAVGTGLNTPQSFDATFCAELQEISGEMFVPNPSKFEGMGSHDSMVELSGALNTLAVSIIKIANDIRFLGSGPYCGLGELIIPSDGLTSSIMPGKRNPTLAEVVAQACFQVMGNNVTVMSAGAAGTFELNVAKPVIIYNVLQSIRILSDSIEGFHEKLVVGLEPDRERLAKNVASSLLVTTSLNNFLGYDKVAQITQKARATNKTPRETVLDLGLLTAKEYDRLVDPLKMALPYQST